jgi:hypothetical protein
MKPEKVEKLGELFGLKFNSNDNFKDSLEKGIRVFNGANSQRILIDSNWSDDEIFEVFGKALKEFGRIERSLEIYRLIQPF